MAESTIKPYDPYIYPPPFDGFPDLMRYIIDKQYIMLRESELEPPYVWGDPYRFHSGTLSTIRANNGGFSYVFFISWIGQYVRIYFLGEIR